MSTLNELAYNVFSSIKPHLSDDENISIEKIKFDIISERALYLRNELNKNRTIDDNILTHLNCKDLIDVDRSLCPDLPLNCLLKRTKDKLPVPLELHHSRAIERVTTVDLLGESIKIIEPNSSSFVGSRKFSQKNIYAFFRDGYLYIQGDKDRVPFIKKIAISLVLEDPTDDFNGESCYDSNSPFPMNKWMESSILNKLKEIYLKVDIQVPTDTLNDSNSEDITT